MNPEQRELAQGFLPFFKDLVLVGGTAVALLLGHRRSVDFDLATVNSLDQLALEARLRQTGYLIDRVLFSSGDELSLLINTVKITFFHFPFSLSKIVFWPESGLYLPDLETLGAMKGYALGRRAEVKDYVDLFFILKTLGSIDGIVRKAKEIFGGLFNVKLFAEQLCYFADLNWEQDIDYLVPCPDKEEIKSFLVQIALDMLGPKQR